MKIWIYADGAQKGPFSEEELRALNISSTTPVWYEGMPKWLPAAEVPAVMAIIEGDKASEDASVQDSVEVSENVPASETETEEKAEVAVSENGASAEETVVAAVEEPVQEQKPVSKYAPGQRASKIYRERPEEPCPPTYLGWSVFLTVCCCSPVSLASLIASIFVTSYYNKGDLRKSQRASEWAAWLIMIAIALGFFPMMIMSLFTN